MSLILLLFGVLLLWYLLSHRRKKKSFLSSFGLLLALIAIFWGMGTLKQDQPSDRSSSSFSTTSSVKTSSEEITSKADDLPKTAAGEYMPIDAKGKIYVVVNHNVPYFNDDDLTSTKPFATYGDLDNLGRVTQANALLGQELMPAKDREEISSVKPTGWIQRRYTEVPGGWLYNRSHLIGYQLTGENANPKNLMTGTKSFNVEGMLPFENFVAHYIERTDNHVRYRITPVFEGDNLLASGIYMEAFSIEDNGKGVQFNVYVPNTQPGVELNYADGSSKGSEGPQASGKISRSFGS